MICERVFFFINFGFFDFGIEVDFFLGGLIFFIVICCGIRVFFLFCFIFIFEWWSILFTSIWFCGIVFFVGRVCVIGDVIFSCVEDITFFFINFWDLCCWRIIFCGIFEIILKILACWLSSFFELENGV